MFSLIAYLHARWHISVMSADRILASVPNTIEVVKISFPQGLVLISIIQLRYSKGCIKFF